MTIESHSSDKANSNYRLSALDSSRDLPRREEVTAVFLVGFREGQVLAARNERGWDVPGGHLEDGEDLLAGLGREAAEEAGASFAEAVPFAWLSPGGSRKKMVFFACEVSGLAAFVAQEDAFERALLEPGELLARYHGDRALLARLLSLAAAALGKTIEPETAN